MVDLSAHEFDGSPAHIFYTRSQKTHPNKIRKKKIISQDQQYGSKINAKVLKSLGVAHNSYAKASPGPNTVNMTITPINLL